MAREPLTPSDRDVPVRRPPSSGSRALPVVFTFLGVVVIAITQAVSRGIVTGVRIEWPAYLVGAAMVAIGIFGLGRRSAEPPTDERGPIRESGPTPEEASEEAQLREVLHSIRAARRSNRWIGH